MRNSPIKNFLIVLALFSLFGCASSANEVRPDMDKPDKLTPADPAKSPGKVYLGAQVSVHGLNDNDTKKLARVFDEQLGVFDPCRALLKDGLFFIEAKWAINKQGQIRVTELVQVIPEMAPLKDCFLNQIKQLALGPQRHVLTGELILEAYMGSRGGSSKGPARQE